jgi:hypothetical protein
MSLNANRKLGVNLSNGHAFPARRRHLAAAAASGLFLRHRRVILTRQL